MTLHTFAQFNIQLTNKFVGTKLQVDDIVGQEIIVHDFRVVPSKHRDNTECLHLQIEMNNKKHVFFTGAKGLIEAVRHISKDMLPFKTTITRDNRFLQFT